MEKAFGDGMEIAYTLLALSLALNVAAVVLVRKALPVAIVRDHRLIRTEIERVHDAVEGLQTRWAAKVIELTNLADECASHMERAEKKRRQAAGAAARAGGAEATEPDLTTSAGLWAAAHRQGLG